MKLFVAVLLSLFLVTAYAEKPELENGDIERQALCTQGKKKMLCVAVRKDSKLYVVAIDEKGEYLIYWVSDKGNILLWARESV